MFVTCSWAKDAFNGAVKAGNDEMVKYFLHYFSDEVLELKVELCIINFYNSIITVVIKCYAGQSSFNSS